MSELVGSVVSVHSGDHADLHKDEQPEVQAELDGIVGDKHRGHSRVAWEGDIPDLSGLPRGTRLHFPSGAVLRVEECNPPCVEMGEEIAAAYTTNDGVPVVGSMFPKHALRLRGVVGVVDVPGPISAGDGVVVRSAP